MPIKKLAQLVLAVEGFLLLTAIVVSTSYQLSRRGPVAESRSRAAEETLPLRVVFRLPEASSSLLGRPVSVSLTGREAGETLVAIPRGEGVYEVTAKLPMSAAGSEQVGVKPVGYLQRVKAHSALIVGQVTIVDFGEVPFLGGDLDGDNKITMADLAGKLLPAFSKVKDLSLKTTGDTRVMDLNDDGVINILDISIVLKNLTELEVRGEGLT